MEKIYSSLKLFKTKKFKTKEEENNYFIRIQEENILEYRKSLLDKFEDYYHVMWSRQYVLYILSFLTIFLSIIINLTLDNHVISISLFIISLISIIYTKILQYFLNKKVIEENFVMGFLNPYIDTLRNII